jgi:hypothetical protein
MPNPFPGMDPYLERPDFWPNVHSSLIVALRDDLAPRLRPNYYVSIEERTYLLEPGGGLAFSTFPDAAVIGEAAPTYQAVGGDSQIVEVELPIPEEIRETYLEIRQVADDKKVITVIELLSPTNKRPGRGRELYEQKRLALLGTKTHLVEIDLLRAGDSPAMRGGPGSHYHILISRWQERPTATLLPFSIRQPIPIFGLPLQVGDEEARVDIGRLLHDLYDRAGYDLRVDYTDEPEPPITAEELSWIKDYVENTDKK